MTDKKKKIEIESNISPKQLFDKYGIGNTGSGKKNIEREKKYWEKKFRESRKKAGPHKDEGVVYKPTTIKSTPKAKAKGGRVGLKHGSKRPKGGLTA